MATVVKAETQAPQLSSKASQKVEFAPPPVRKLDSKLQLAKSLAEAGEYQRALASLPIGSSDPEIVNARGVCLLRLHKFEQAINPLRSVALNTSTFHVHASVPNHIKINFATALFFGGEPAGALDVLSEVKMEKDVGVLSLRQAERQWVASMNFMRRLDWWLNRVATKLRPIPPSKPLGRFIWEVA